MTNMILQCKNVTKRFGGLVALKNVNLEVDEKEIVGLIGPNGSGKTTLFNVICGVYRPEAGSVYFENKNITKLKPSKICKLGIGRTYQLVRPFKNMTVLENVMVGALFGRGKRIDMNTARKEASYWLDFVGLSGHEKTICSALNVALLRRVELARALATEPKLLLLDEVMAGLNPAEVSKEGELIRKIRDVGITIFWIEHVMKAIMNYAERIIVLNFGEKIAEGTPKEIRSHEKVVHAYLGDVHA